MDNNINECTDNCQRDNCSCNNDNMREQMLMKIKELNFAIIELGLYLDTNPDDQRALCMHREYCKKLKELKDKYQKVYGPLSGDGWRNHGHGKEDVIKCGFIKKC